MTKRRDGQSMLVARRVQPHLLLPHSLDLGGDFLASHFQLVPTLAGIGVDFGQVFAQLFAGSQQSLHADRGTALQLRELLGQFEDLATACLQGLQSVCSFAAGGLLVGLEGDLFRSQLLTSGPQSASTLFQPFGVRMLSLRTAAQLGTELIQLRRPGRQALAHDLELTVALRLLLLQSLGLSL